MVSHLFLAADIGMMALSVAAAVFLGAVVLQAEMKMVPTTTTTAMVNEMRHSALSTPPFDPPPREANGGHAGMAVNCGGDNGVFAATVNDDNTMVVVAITSLVNGGDGNGRPCCCGVGG